MGQYTPWSNKAILARNRCNITYLQIKPLYYHCSLISVSYSTTNVHHAKVSTVNCVCTDRTVSRSVLDYLKLAGKLTQQTRLPGRAVAYLSDHGQLHCRKPVRTTSTNPLRKRCYRSFGQTFITTPMLLLAPVWRSPHNCTSFYLDRQMKPNAPQRKPRRWGASFNKLHPATGPNAVSELDAAAAVRSSSSCNHSPHERTDPSIVGTGSQ